MVEKIRQAIKEQSYQVYQVAVMTENGIQSGMVIPGNLCNDAYSVTKLFINTLVAMLVEEGTLRLEDRLMEKLAPQLTFPYDDRWNQVTVRHALSHKMGVTDGIFDVDRDDPQSYQTTNYLQYVLSHPPTETPGEYRLYTDVAHYLLSRVITQVTGSAADELINARICMPLEFYPPAWQRCPMGYTIGSTGAFVKTSDLVKLGWLYLNEGEYQGKRFISREWVALSEQERFDIYPTRHGDFIGKAGVYGQNLLYSREKQLAVAWQGFEAEENEKPLRELILNVIDGQ